MRTKTLLCTAAVLAAGVAASMAQTVYSVNAVGYVNVTVRQGYNLISNPLNGTNNLINTVIPAAGLPNDTALYTWNTGNQSFNQADVVDGGVWVDQNFNPSTTVLNPGSGFFVLNVSPASFNITFVGEVPQGNLTNSVPSNYSFQSSIVPQSAGLSTMGFVGNVDMLYQTFNPVTQSYDQAITYVGVGPGNSFGWEDQNFNAVDPTPAVAQAFVVFNPGPTRTWGRTFSVNN